jgi:hypothetical protein
VAVRSAGGIASTKSGQERIMDLFFYDFSAEIPIRLVAKHELKWII